MVRKFGIFSETCGPAGKNLEVCTFHHKFRNIFVERFGIVGVWGVGVRAPNKKVKGAVLKDWRRFMYFTWEIRDGKVSTKWVPRLLTPEQICSDNKFGPSGGRTENSFSNWWGILGSSLRSITMRSLPFYLAELVKFNWLRSRMSSLWIFAAIIGVSVSRWRPSRPGVVGSSVDVKN